MIIMDDRDNEETRFNRLASGLKNYNQIKYYQKLKPGTLSNKSLIFMPNIMKYHMNIPKKD